MQRNEINSYTENMQKLLENQYQNLFLWTGVLMALGAGLYFALPFEPKLFFPIVITALLAVLALVPRMPLLLRGMVIFAFGFCYAYSYTRIIDTPTLHHDIRNTNIVANVADIDTANNKTRLYLNTDDDMTVRVSLPDDISPDDMIIAQFLLESLVTEFSDIEQNYGKYILVKEK